MSAICAGFAAGTRSTSRGKNRAARRSAGDTTHTRLGVSMSNQLQFTSTALALSLSCALGGCLDAADDALDTDVAVQAIYHNEVRLRRIQAVVLQEGGDEIFLTASQSSGGSVNVIR